MSLTIAVHYRFAGVISHTACSHIVGVTTRPVIEPENLPRPGCIIDVLNGLLDSRQHLPVILPRTDEHFHCRHTVIVDDIRVQLNAVSLIRKLFPENDHACYMTEVSPHSFLMRRAPARE